MGPSRDDQIVLLKNELRDTLREKYAYCCTGDHEKIYVDSVIYKNLINNLYQMLGQYHKLGYNKINLVI